MGEDKKVTAMSVGELDGEKTYKCEKCSNVKKESKGNFVLEGSSFCCIECCGSPDDKKGDDHKHEDEGVCEFC